MRSLPNCKLSPPYRMYRMWVLNKSEFGLTRRLIRHVWLVMSTRPLYYSLKLRVVVAQGRKYLAPSQYRTRYSVVIAPARQTCQVITLSQSDHRRPLWNNTFSF